MDVKRARAISRIIVATDPKFKDVVEFAGPAPFGLKKPNSTSFESLTTSILSQQLSIKAADTIIKRVTEIAGGKINPESISCLSERQLRGAGCSGAKARAVSELAEAAKSNSIPIRSLHRLNDDEIFAHLLPLFGIGQWTVEMFLMFQLGRPDIWPVGDLGVRRGWERIHRLKEEIEPKALHLKGEKFAPYRSYVAWYCWRAIELYSLR